MGLLASPRGTFGFIMWDFWLHHVGIKNQQLVFFVYTLENPVTTFFYLPVQHSPYKLFFPVWIHTYTRLHMKQTWQQWLHCFSHISYQIALKVHRWQTSSCSRSPLTVLIWVIHSEVKVQRSKLRQRRPKPYCSGIFFCNIMWIQQCHQAGIAEQHTLYHWSFNQSAGR